MSIVCSGVKLTLRSVSILDRVFGPPYSEILDPPLNITWHFYLWYCSKSAYNLLNVVNYVSCKKQISKTYRS